MKGLVFTEFMEMVEQRFSANMVDDIIEASELSSGGAYTTVGTYPHVEMLALMEHLSQRVGIPVPELTRLLGRYLFGRYVKLYPVFFQRVVDPFDFLDRLEYQHQSEVRKLYPDAVFPHFQTRRESPQKLILSYRSHRPFAAMAEGLIEGCLAYYKIKADIEVVDLSSGAGTHAEFHITRTDEP